MDIYTLKSSPSHIRARFKTDISDETARSEKIEKVYQLLSERTRNIAEVHRFKLTKDMAEAFVYYAHLDLSETPAYQETIVIGDQAEAANESYEVTDVSVEADAEAGSAEIEASSADGETAVGQTDEQVDLTDFLESEENDESETEEAVRQLEAVDAKTLRQALDTLSLPRSSNVRLVLTRLYRSAIDPEELEESIDIEADKINTSHDMNELRMIREMQAIDFLNPLIELLWQAVSRDSGNG